MQSTITSTSQTTTTMTAPTGTASSASATRAQRELEHRILWDLLIFIVLLIPILICEFAIDPFRRGFFCDDESIRYPFRPNTVTEVGLGVLLGLPPLALFFVVEYVLVRCRGRLKETLPLFGFEVPLFLANWCKHTAYYSIGLVLTLNFTELGKYMIGRLRPHFMALCQPQLLDGSTCADAQNQYRYIEAYECTVAPGFRVSDVRQARLSFPSGHSSLTCFGMIFLMLYLQQTMTWRGSKLARHTLQFVLVMLAWFTALSRVMDNWHHWSDVLVGSIIGLAGALLTARYIAKYFSESEQAMCDLKLSLPRQDTTTSLQEIISDFTPPPYTLDSDGMRNFVTKM